MKKFTKYLAIGLTIAVVVALALCYLAWSLHSLHRMIWFIIVAIACGAIYRYMSQPDYKEYTDKNAKTLYEQTKFRQISKWEQFGVVVRTSVGVIILGALVWTIGYGISCLFEWKPDYWEMHLLYGAATVAAICLAIYLICSIWVFCKGLFYGKSQMREITKSVLMWIIVVVCSLAVAGAILYFLLPLALAL